MLLVNVEFWPKEKMEANSVDKAEKIQDDYEPWAQNHGVIVSI